MKSILDPSFSYVRSDRTDLRKTFQRVRKEMQAASAEAGRVASLRQTGAAFRTSVSKGRPLAAANAPVLPSEELAALKR